MNKKVLHSIIDHHTSLYKNKIAIQDAHASITYGDFKIYSDAVANFLLESGIKKAEVIATYIPAGISYVATIVGINKAGGIFMPLEMQFPAKRIQTLLEYTSPRIIVTDENSKTVLLEKLKGEKKPDVEKIVQLNKSGDMLKADIFNNSGDLLETKFFEGEEKIPLNVDGEDSCYLLYTSGSTGAPKVIEGVHKSLSHFIHWEVKEFNLNENTVVSQLAPVSFDVSLRDIFVPLLCGGRLCIPPPEVKHQPARLLQWVKENGITLIHTVPSVLRLLTKELQDSPGDVTLLKSLEYILLAGEALYGKDVLHWRSLLGESIQLVNVYGPTETTLAKVFNRVGVITGSESVVPLGKPISNTFVVIIKNKQLCEVGEIGEIHIKTPFRSKGYYKNDALTKEKFIQNPLHCDHEDIIYKTGDLGKYLPDGNIAFIGRQDNQVKIRGNRVELGEVEEVLRRFTGIQQSVVTAIHKENGENALACYYTAESETNVQNMRAFIAQYLPEYMQPSYYIFMESFPLNLNGKIDKKALPSPEELIYEKLPYEAPGTTTEQKLAEIWAQVLTLKRVGVNNSFFELGGHSLSATKAVSRIYKELKKDVSLKDFFEYPTIRKLSGFLSEKQSTVYKKINPAPVQKHYPLSNAQMRLWILDQQQQGMVAYNIPYICYLKGALSIVALKKAFLTVIERHESLRTTFMTIAGEPRQVIHPSVNFQLVEIAPEAGLSAEEVTQYYLNKELTTPFDLISGPLVRAGLVELGEEKYLFFFTMHHIISDGWSLGVLMHEIIHLYDAYKSNKENFLAPLTVQYKDFTVWQQAALQKGEFEISKHYWHQQLGSCFPQLSLPKDHHEKEIKNYEGGSHSFRIMMHESTLIRRICEENEVSLFMFLLSVIKLFLYKYNSHGDLVVGSSLAGRNHPDLEDQVGFYLNNVVLRSQVKKEDNFRDYLRHIKDITLQAYKHQGYPLDLLTEELSNRIPFYNVLVVLNNSELNGRKRDLQKLSTFLSLEHLEIVPQAAKLDLSFFCGDEPEITIKIEYNKGLFLPEKIEKIGAHIQLLIKEITADISIPVSLLVSNLTDMEEKELLAENMKTISENF
jgi:amino acid adenylation domain-containing protein